MQSKIGAAVENAVKSGVSVWDWLGGLGNMDDKIGSVVIQFSPQQLLDAGANGIALQKRWKNEGDWQITGHITATAIPEITHVSPGVLHAMGVLQPSKS